jgi:hypothetical protein
MYAKFVACYEAIGQAVWFKKFVPRLRVVDGIEKSLKIYCDNEPIVQYSYNNKKSDVIKHINIKYYAYGSIYKRLTIQYVQGECSQHGFKEKHMNLG